MLLIILIFVIGAVFGSFYTVIGLRMPISESIVKPNSHCDTCNHNLKWYELIPVISFLIQGGKCRNCKTKLSWIYPVIEILTGSLFALFFYLYGIEYEFFAGTIISSVLVIIFVSDFKYKLILDSPIIIGSIIIIILKLIYFDYIAALYAIASGALLFVFMLVIKLVGDKAFKKESLGGGDVKLALFMGVSLGVQLGLSSLIIASFLAFPYALISIFFKSESEIPFGPFLITSLLLVFIFMDQIVTFITKLI